MEQASFSRKIPELFPKVKQWLTREYHIVIPRTRFRNILYFFFCFFLFLAIFLGAVAYRFTQSAAHAREERKAVVQSLQRWESVLSQHSDYPDAYYEAAVAAARLGDVAKSKMYLERAINLDPDFQAAQKLEKELNG